MNTDTQKMRNWPPNRWSISCFFKRSPLKNPPPLKVLNETSLKKQHSVKMEGGPRGPLNLWDWHYLECGFPRGSWSEGFSGADIDDDDDESMDDESMDGIIVSSSLEPRDWLWAGRAAVESVGNQHFWLLLGETHEFCHCGANARGHACPPFDDKGPKWKFVGDKKSLVIGLRLRDIARKRL